MSSSVLLAKRTITAFSFIALACICFSAEAAQAEKVVTADVLINQLAPAVVQVRTSSGTGSGSLYRDDNRVMLLTNRHVVEGHDEVTIAVLVDVNEPAEPMFKARLHAFSGQYDIAVYQVTEDLDGNAVNAGDLSRADNRWRYQLPELAYVQQNEVLRRGTPLAILGYPGLLDAELVYTSGIVSAVQMTDSDEQRMAAWYRTNAHMSPGNSGGVALTEDGRVIGVPTQVIHEEATGGRLGSVLSMPLALRELNSENRLTAWADYSDPERHLQLDAEPTYGRHVFSSGQWSQDLTAGGTRSVRYLGDGCMGYAAQANDAVIEVSQNQDTLHVWFNADPSDKDATLAVLSPDGQWHCNDDRDDATRNPGIAISDAVAGDYQVWVGGYSQEDFFPGTLLVSTQTPDLNAATGAQESTGMDWRGTPTYGSTNLQALFTPDPFSQTMIAGGANNAQQQLNQSGCTGFAAQSPDFRLHFSGNTAGLRVYFVPDEPGKDTTLLISDPSERWHCNDDAHDSTLNPLVNLTGTSEGQFDIWVGSYQSGEYISGTLYITELSVEVP